MSDPFPNPQKIPSAFRKRNSFLTKLFLAFQLQKAKLGPRACFQIIIKKRVLSNTSWRANAFAEYWVVGSVKKARIFYAYTF